MADVLPTHRIVMIMMMEMVKKKRRISFEDMAMRAMSDGDRGL
jgi:hypothetical protein